MLGDLSPGLSDTEKKLICGDPDRKSWATIPIPQARFNLTNFLQERGYFHPVFKQETADGDRVTVEVGSPTRVTSLSAEGAPESLRLERKRRVIGEILTPNLLGTIEQWVLQQLQRVGYPCPKATAEANPDTGAVVVRVETGPLQDLVAIFEDSIPGMQSGVLRRYDAFRLGERFNGDLLTVTSNRIMSQNLMQSTHLTATCEKGGAVARQFVTPGPPRLLIFGVGVDTEGAIQLKASWRNARVGNRASWIDVSTRLSTKEQRVEALANWYHFPHPTRRFLQPYYGVRHQNENAFEVIGTRVRLSTATTWDNQELGAELYVGPVLDLVRTLRGSGQGNPNAAFVSLETQLRVRSHDFEYYATDPRTGGDARLTVDLAPGPGSTVPVHRATLDGQMLWNLREYDPPLWIFGLRGALQTTWSEERPGIDSRIPANFFWYLGGSGDLRGFSRQSVPALGAMTAAYLNPELRFADLLPIGLQPIAFFDVGMIGREPVSLDSPLLYSPGAGLRYKSPFGVFRTTLARGFPVSPYGGWTFYFSFGEEF